MTDHATELNQYFKQSEKVEEALNNLCAAFLDLDCMIPPPFIDICSIDDLGRNVDLHMSGFEKVYVRNGVVSS